MTNQEVRVQENRGNVVLINESVKNGYIVRYNQLTGEQDYVSIQPSEGMVSFEDFLDDGELTKIAENNGTVDYSSNGKISCVENLDILQ